MHKPRAAVPSACGRTARCTRFPLAADVGRRGFHTKESNLILEILAHIYATVIVTKPHAHGCAGGERSELLPHRLPDRLQCFEAMTSFHSMDTEAFDRAVVDRGKMVTCPSC